MFLSDDKSIEILFETAIGDFETKNAKPNFLNVLK